MAGTHGADGGPPEAGPRGAVAPKAHRGLRAWQAAIELVDVVYVFTAAFPTEERYGLAGQMRRAAVSVPSNIAEGAARASNAEFLRFLHAPAVRWQSWTPNWRSRGGGTISRRRPCAAQVN